MQYQTKTNTEQAEKLRSEQVGKLEFEREKYVSKTEQAAEKARELTKNIAEKSPRLNHYKITEIFHYLQTP